MFYIISMKYSPMNDRQSTNIFILFFLIKALAVSKPSLNFFFLLLERCFSIPCSLKFAHSTLIFDLPFAFKTISEFIKDASKENQTEIDEDPVWKISITLIVSLKSWNESWWEDISVNIFNSRVRVRVGSQWVANEWLQWAWNVIFNNPTIS